MKNILGEKISSSFKSNKTQSSKKTLIFLIAIPIIIFLLSLGGNSDKKEENKFVFEEQNLQGQVTYLIEKAVDKKTNLEKYPDRIVNMTTSGDSGNLKELDITLNGDNNISKNWMRNGLYFDTIDIMQQLVENYLNIELVKISWQFPLIDAYGNEKLDKVLELHFNNEAIYKANWDNILVENVRKIADYTYIHPAIQ